jgi:hypothetical protein
MHFTPSKAMCRSLTMRQQFPCTLVHMMMVCWAEVCSVQTTGRDKYFEACILIHRQNNTEIERCANDNLEYTVQ